MKLSSISFGILLSLLLFTACKGGDKIDPDASFIAFTIDGQDYRINSTNSTLEGSHSGQTLTQPPSHILTTVFSSQTNAEVANVTLLLNSPEPLEVKVYQNLSVGNGGQFLAALPDRNIYGLDPLNGRGSIELTEVDTLSGGVIAGKFSFSNLNLQDENQQIISSGHSVSEGSFRVVMD